MRRLWPTLIALLGLTLLAEVPASAAVAASIENRTSGSPSGSNNLVGTEPRLTEEAVGKKVALAYEVASDDAVAARSAAQAARLAQHLRQLEQYGKGGVKALESGRIRYYGELESARNAGEMAGRRLVREWNPATGATRTWHETVDSAGRTRIVRPETGDPKIHHEFDAGGNYVGSW